MSDHKRARQGSPSSPSSPSESRISLLDLPPEIVTAIVQLSTPPYIFSSDLDIFTERYPTLRALCLVSKAIRVVALPELYKHVRIGLGANAMEFVRTLLAWEVQTKFVASPIAARVESLVHTGRSATNGGASPEDFSIFLRSVIKQTPNLKQLWITRVQKVEMFDLQVATKLETLHLDEVSFVPFGVRVWKDVIPYFPNLLSVAVGNMNIATLHKYLFTANSFPNLSSIALRWEPATLTSFDLLPPFIPLPSLIQRLVLGRFTNDSDFADHLLTLLPSLTSLQHLSVNNPSFLLEHLTLLNGTKLISLHIGAHYLRRLALKLDAETILPILRDRPASIEHLERLSLPIVWNWGWQGRARNRNDLRNAGVREAIAAREDTRVLCEKLGIVLRERKLTEDGEDFKEPWQNCVEWT